MAHLSASQHLQMASEKVTSSSVTPTWGDVGPIPLTDELTSTFGKLCKVEQRIFIVTEDGRLR